MSDVFRLYLSIIASLLVFAWIVLAVLSWGLKRNVGNIWSIYRSWLVMIPLAMTSIYIGRVATIVFVTALMFVACYEFARATKLAHDRWMMSAVLLLIGATGLTALVNDPFHKSAGLFPLFLAMPMYAIALVLIVPVLRNKVQGQLRIISLAIVAYVFLGWMLGHLGHLANSQHAEGYLLFLVFAVEANDIAAFTFGKLFGRHPLRSAISPKKTWEGALGGFCVSLALPWLLRFSFPSDFGETQLLLTGIIVGFGGPLGDLAISVIKRDLGVKDMGATIPGHGGVLDRIDSLLFTSPFFVHMLNYFNLL
ncbi:MAG TPA: phosphatidate cytidylyltransferase [Pirellulaceae bacterium]|nr:phosphatidate cytidylyltransferase [Pirellulaceae bacterium]